MQRGREMYMCVSMERERIYREGTRERERERKRERERGREREREGVRACAHVRKRKRVVYVCIQRGSEM